MELNSIWHTYVRYLSYIVRVKKYASIHTKRSAHLLYIVHHI